MDIKARPEGVEAHPGLEAVAVGPAKGHASREGEVEDGEVGAGKKGGGLVGGGASADGLDDDPGERIRDKLEGVEEASEVEGLEGAGIGWGDDEEGAGVLDAILEALLALDAVEDAVGAHGLGGVRVGPRADADAVATDDDAAGGGVGGRGL